MRWILLIPVTLLTFVIVGPVVRILIGDILLRLMMPEDISGPFKLLISTEFEEIYGAVITGFVTVYVSMKVAPAEKKQAGIITVILIIFLTLALIIWSFVVPYWPGVPNETIVWRIVLLLIAPTSGLISLWYFQYRRVA